MRIHVSLRAVATRLFVNSTVVTNVTRTSNVGSNYTAALSMYERVRAVVLSQYRSPCAARIPRCEIYTVASYFDEGLRRRGSRLALRPRQSGPHNACARFGYECRPCFDVPMLYHTTTDLLINQMGIRLNTVIKSSQIKR